MRPAPDKISNTFLARALGGLIGLGLGYASQFVFNITVARVLSVAEAGKVFQVIAVAALIGLATRFGMERVVMREVSRSPDTGLQTRTHSMFLTSLVVPGLSAASVVVVVALLDLGLWRAVFGADLLLADKVLLAAAPFVSLCFVLSCVARGIRATFRAGMVQLAGIYGSTSLIVLTAIVIFRSPTKVEFAAIFLIASAACFAVSLLWLIRHPRLRQTHESSATKESNWSGLGYFYAVTLLSFGLSGADVVSVSILMNDEATALYTVAARLAFALNVGLAGINSILFSTVAQAHSQGNRRELQESVSQAAMWSSCIALCMAMVIGLGGVQILRVFGEAYVAAESLLHILLLANVFNASMGGVSVVLQMSGHEKVAVACLAFAMTLMLVLYVVLVPRYGLVGAGIGTSAMLVVTPLSMGILIRRYLGFWPVPDRGTIVVFWWSVLALLFWFKGQFDESRWEWVLIGLVGSIAVLVSTIGLRNLIKVSLSMRARG